MLTIKRILHPTDFSACAAGALRHAAALARRFNAELTVLHVLPGLGADVFFGLGDVPGRNPSERLLWTPIAERMERALLPWRGQMAVHRTGGYGPLPGPAIVDYARQAGTDLIVMGTCGTGAGTEARLGGVAREVIHRAPCPVLTVREGDAQDGAVRIAHVLAPVDPTEPVTAEIRYANEIAMAFHARVSLIHALDWRQHPAATDAMLPHLKATALAQLRENCVRALGQLRRMGATGEPVRDVDVRVLVGSPGDEIVRFIRDEAVDLVVLSMRRPMGAHDGAGADLVEFVAAHAACPVLSINELGASHLGVKRRTVRAAVNAVAAAPPKPRQSTPR